MAAILSFLAFQAGWFACVLGAGRGMPWLGVVVVPALLVLRLWQCSAVERRGELELAIAAALLGFLADSALTALGAFAPLPFLYAAPWSPPWMVMLWVNQAIVLNTALAWMRGRYVFGGILGAIGGPLAYAGGAKLGAAADVPSASGMVAIGLVWAAAFPALLWLAARVPTTTSLEPKP